MLLAWGLLKFTELSWLLAGLGFADSLSVCVVCFFCTLSFTYQEILAPKG